MTTPKIALLDYGVGNLYSVANALKTVGANVVITDKPKDIQQADKILLPGVGAMQNAMMHMQQHGVDVAVKDAIQQKPVMAICVGMQAMFEYSTEGTKTPCLNIIKGSVERFDENWTQNNQPIKIPHVGWNQVDAEGEHPLWQGCNHEYFYFTHSYYCKPDLKEAVNQNMTLAWCDYGQKFCASLIKDNLFITQFHPEKSHNAGLRLLSNFVHWRV